MINTITTEMKRTGMCASIYIYVLYTDILIHIYKNRAALARVTLRYAYNHTSHTVTIDVRVATLYYQVTSIRVLPLWHLQKRSLYFARTRTVCVFKFNRKLKTPLPLRLPRFYAGV